MKQQDITPEIIKLSKEIAEHWRMEIYEGCWVMERWLHHGDIPQWDKYLVSDLKLMEYRNVPNFPIPSISDCLEKLRERHEVLPDYINKKHFDRSLLNIFKNYLEGKFTVVKVHYWLLSALLEVLRKEKR